MLNSFQHLRLYYNGTPKPVRDDKNELCNTHLSLRFESIEKNIDFSLEPSMNSLLGVVKLIILLTVRVNKK